MEKRVVSAKELRTVMDHLRKQVIYHTLGSSSIYVPSTQTKYMDIAVCREWPNLEGYIEMMMPGEAARTEMNRSFPGLERVGWNGPHVKLFDMRVPLHYEGPTRGEFTYIDLKAAYWQIYKRLWLDVAYPCGFYGLYSLSEVARALRDWKAARNALIGLVRSREIVGVRGSRRYTLTTKNKFLSPCLWATVMSLLNWIAFEALRWGAIYINTDGYIFPTQTLQELDGFMEFLIDHEINFEIRTAGEGEIVSWNNYQIGSFRTKSNELGLTTRSKEFSCVKQTARNWGKYWLSIGAISRANNLGLHSGEQGQEVHPPENNAGHGRTQDD